VNKYCEGKVKEVLLALVANQEPEIKYLKATAVFLYAKDKLKRCYF